MFFQSIDIWSVRNLYPNICLPKLIFSKSWVQARKSNLYNREDGYPSRCSLDCKQPALTVVLDLAWPWRLVRRRQSQVAATPTFQPGTSLLLFLVNVLKPRIDALHNVCLICPSFCFIIPNWHPRSPPVNAQHHGVLLLGGHNMETFSNLRLSK